MRYSLDQFQDIPDKARQTLAAHGIMDSDQFLNACALPEHRIVLAQKSRLSASDIKRWAGLADLVRVKGIGPVTATLLVDSGECGNVQELIAQLTYPKQENDRELTGMQALKKGFSTFVRRLTHPLHSRKPKTVVNLKTPHSFDSETSIQAAAAMRQRLAMFIKKSDDHNSIPSITQLLGIVEEALELRPRLILRKHSVQVNFRKAMHQRSRKMCETALKYYVIMWGILVFISLVALGIMYSQVSEALEPSQESYVLFRMYDSLFAVSARYFLRSSIIFSVLILAALALAFLLFVALLYFTTYFPSVGLMTNISHQTFFMKAIGLSLKKEERAIQAALVVFILVFGTAVLYFAYQNLNFDDISLEPYALGASFFGALVGLIASSATMVHVMVGVKMDWERDQESFKRYLIYILVNVIVAPVFGFLVLFAILNSVNYGANHIFDNSLAPHYHAALEETCQQEALQGTKEDTTNPEYEDALAFCQKEIMPNIIESLEPSIRMSDPEISLWIQAGPRVGWIVNKVVVWMLLTGVALMFVFPYLSIGGWWRGLFYIAVLVTASQIENLLQSNSATWLNLEPDATGTILLIWFFILTSALIFDWIYDGITEPKKLCPNCQTLIDDFAYCPACGLAQT